MYVTQHTIANMYLLVRAVVGVWLEVWLQESQMRVEEILSCGEY